MKDFIIKTVTNTLTMIVSIGALLMALVIHKFFISALLIAGALLFDIVIYNLIDKVSEEPPEPISKPQSRPRAKTMVCDFTEGSAIRTRRPRKD